MGYRIDETVGVAKGNDPETLYMVTDGTHVNEGCVAGLQRRHRAECAPGTHTRRHTRLHI